MSWKKLANEEHERLVATRTEFSTLIEKHRILLEDHAQAQQNLAYANLQLEAALEVNQRMVERIILLERPDGEIYDEILSLLTSDVPQDHVRFGLEYWLRTKIQEVQKLIINLKTEGDTNA